jgi:glucosamine kinase
VTFFLGIDGGGTKTRCVLGDDNSILASGSGSGCSILRVGEACARDSLAGAIHEACVRAGVSPQQVSRTCIGAAGAGDGTVAATIKRLLASLVGGEIEVVGDIEIALESSFGAGPGVIVVAGTGSIAHGRNAKGRTARAGGWGRILCDEGSAHWIVIKAMDEALHALDRGENPPLLADLMTALNAKSPTDLSVYAGGNPTPEFAPLFPVVLDAATRGDSIALHVLQRAGNELAGLAETVISRLSDGEQVGVATHGGVFASSPQVEQAFEQRLREMCALAEVVDRVVDPTAGALARARRGFGVRQ